MSSAVVNPPRLLVLLGWALSCPGVCESGSEKSGSTPHNASALSKLRTDGSRSRPKRRLRIINGCDAEPIWVAHMASVNVGPDPQNLRLLPGESYDFLTPDNLTGTRYWPKMRCDEHGNRCIIGESGGPGEECNNTIGCAPPVDTKFEGSFGQPGDVDWVDVSFVDGWTLPFRFEMHGSCSAGEGNRNVSNVIDCSGLSLNACPTEEEMVNISSSTVNLQTIHPQTGGVVGCYSPCSKITLNQWSNADAEGRSPFDDDVGPYCCPTPPISPEACRGGPVGETEFVKSVHRYCPGVYGYSYDDGMGLILCKADTMYEMTFYCPENDANANITSTTGSIISTTLPASVQRVSDSDSSTMGHAQTPAVNRSTTRRFRGRHFSYERRLGFYAPGQYGVAKELCNGTSECQFRNLTDAQLFCDKHRDCSAILLFPYKHHCAGGFGCYTPRSGTATAEALWDRKGGVAWVKRQPHAPELRIGQRVQCRDAGQMWAMGTITSVSPLKVRKDGWTYGYRWDDVRSEVVVMGKDSVSSAQQGMLERIATDSSTLNRRALLATGLIVVAVGMWTAKWRADRSANARSRPLLLLMESHDLMGRVNEGSISRS